MKKRIYKHIYPTNTTNSGGQILKSSYNEIKEQKCLCDIIRIHHECEGEIEKSIPRITNSHHEACRVMTNGDREDGFFCPSSHK